MRQREVVRKNVLSQERCEALLVSPSEERIAALETKAGSAHTAHDPALVSPWPTGLRLYPDQGMHLLVTVAVPPFLRMQRNHETVCDDYHTLPLKR